MAPVLVPFRRQGRRGARRGQAGEVNGDDLREQFVTGREPLDFKPRRGTRRRTQVESHLNRPAAPGIIEILPQPGSVLLPALVILRARAVDYRENCTLVLMRDGFATECWRQLQLNLRQALSAGPG